MPHLTFFEKSVKTAIGEIVYGYDIATICQHLLAKAYLRKRCGKISSI